MFCEKIESQPLGRSRAMSVAMLRAQLRIDYKIKLRPGDLVASQGGYLGKIFVKTSTRHIHLASEGTDRTWSMRRSFKSPNYEGD